MHSWWQRLGSSKVNVFPTHRSFDDNANTTGCASRGSVVIHRLSHPVRLTWMREDRGSYLELPRAVQASQPLPLHPQSDQQMLRAQCVLAKCTGQPSVGQSWAAVETLIRFLIQEGCWLHEVDESSFVSSLSPYGLPASVRTADD